MADLTINYTIPFGSSARIGYKQISSSDPYTYITPYPTYASSPYLITGIPSGSYQVEITAICQNCSGGIYSDPIVVNAETL